MFPKVPPQLKAIKLRFFAKGQVVAAAQSVIFIESSNPVHSKFTNRSSVLEVDFLSQMLIPPHPRQMNTCPRHDTKLIILALHAYEKIQQNKLTSSEDTTEGLLFSSLMFSCLN